MKTVGGSQNHLKWIENVLTNPRACHFAVTSAKAVAAERGVDISRFINVVRLRR